MVTSSLAPSSPPRWKVIRDELFSRLPQFEFGSNFYTIADICKEYGVSTITARRVLDELQAEGMVEKIRSRGTVVRRLSTRTSVRLITPAGVRPDYHTYSVVMRRQIAGMTAFAQQSNMDFDTISETHLPTVFSRRTDTFGFLVSPQVSRESLDFLRARKLPHVFVNPLMGWKGVPHVRADKKAAGYLAAKHLLDLGHRRIAYVLGSISRKHFRDRLMGYRAAIKEAGIKFDWSLVYTTDGEHPEQDDQALTELLALRSPPTAIMAGDDNRAIQLLESCRRRGINVPQDMSILGYPNYPETKLTSPPLSVVDAKYEEVGQVAMRALLIQMNEHVNPKRQALVVAPELVDRGSTGPARRTKKIVSIAEATDGRTTVSGAKLASFPNEPAPRRSSAPIRSMS